MRTFISFLGALVAIGFLAASAIANYLFGLSLGKSYWEAHLYGAVGILAVLTNALAPFYISWSLDAKRWSTAASIIALWSVCLCYSTTSALGFAAQNREGTAFTQQMSHDEYEDLRQQILDLETRKKDASKKERERLNREIDDARKRLELARAESVAPVDPQSQFLAKLSRGILAEKNVRDALIALFAVMVELGATLGLFAAISHSQKQPAPTPPKLQIVAPTVSRWTPQDSK